MPSEILTFGMQADQTIDLPRMVRMTTEYGQARDWNDCLLMHINLILEELAANVLLHGRRPRRRFDVTIREEPHGRVQLDFRDDDEPFDPLAEAPPPDLSSNALGRTPGGLGVHLIRSITAEAAYRREDGHNVLSLVLDNPPQEG